MDRRTGEIKAWEDFDKKDKPYLIPVERENISSERWGLLEKFGKTKIGKNEPCACGSGKKFKKCCFYYRHLLKGSEPVVSEEAPEGLSF